MSFFGKILEKLGLESAKTEPVPAPTPSQVPSPATAAPAVAAPAVAAPAVPVVPPTPRPVAVVDVVAQLEKLAAAGP